MSDTLIGQGSYGKIYYNPESNTVIKQFRESHASIFIRELSMGIYLSKWPYFGNVISFNIEKLQIVMEPWACDLRSIITSGRGTTEERLSILKDVVNAINIMHSKGMTHADIKTANVLVKEVDGRIQGALIDFGLSSLTAYANVSCTTPIYKEPISLNSRSHDIYSLGVLCLELFGDVILTRPPKYSSAIAMASRIKDPVMSSLVRSMLEPERTSRITASNILSTLVTNPEDRYQPDTTCRCYDKDIVNEVPEIKRTLDDNEVLNSDKVSVCMSYYDTNLEDEPEAINASMILASSIFNGKFTCVPTWNDRVVTHMSNMLISDLLDCFLCCDTIPGSPVPSCVVSEPAKDKYRRKSAAFVGYGRQAPYIGRNSVTNSSHNQTYQ